MKIHNTGQTAAQQQPTNTREHDKGCGVSPACLHKSRLSACPFVAVPEAAALVRNALVALSTALDSIDALCHGLPLPDDSQQDSGGVLVTGPSAPRSGVLVGHSSSDTVSRDSAHAAPLSHATPGIPVPADPLLSRLTPREQEILCLLYAGLRNTEIAHTLGIKPRTAKGHVSHLLARFDATNRTELVACALDRGYLAPRRDLT